MTEDQVVALVIRVFETVSQRHEVTGRHEFNRIDVQHALEGIRLSGLPPESKPVADQVSDVKKLF
jgi:hypothetical protein